MIWPQRHTISSQPLQTDLIVFRHKMGKRMKKVMDALDKASSKKMDSSNDPPSMESSRSELEIKERPTQEVLHPKDVVGRDFDKWEVMELVLEDADIDHARSKQKLRVVPIVGDQGIGKTTLAQLVYDAAAVKKHFHPMMWVSVSDVVNLRLTVQKLIESANQKTVENSGAQMERLRMQLQEMIKAKRFFLVLDDVRDKDQELWLSLKSLLTGGAGGSTVLVTTRSERVGKTMRTFAQSYHLGPLDREESWVLLKRAAFGRENQGQAETATEPDDKVQELEETGRKIAEKCKGVPLVIHVVGKLLRESPTDGLWKKLLVEKESIAQVMRSSSVQIQLDEDQKKVTATGMMMEDTHSFISEEEVIGRNADKEEIMKRLLEDNVFGSSAIIGDVGLGKTALAQLIFNDSQVKDHFDLRIWVCLTEVFDWKVIVEKILESVASGANNPPGHLQADELERLLSQEILGKRYFLVLDDVGRQNDATWSRLLGLLAVGARGSRLVVTTRLEEVKISTAGKHHSYELKPLEEKISWELFVKVAFENGQQPTNSKITEIGKEIVSKCGGIPLAIRTMGGILSSKDEEKEWQSFYEKDFKMVNLVDMLPTVKLSYDHLPYYLKPCFAYCCLFPNDYEIDVPMLVSFWMEHGFIRTSSDSNLEDVGFDYFEVLLKKSFFQETMRDERGRTTKCKMQNLRRKLAISTAENACKNLGMKEEDHDTNLRHVSFDFHLDSSWHVRLLAHSKRNIQTLILPRQSQWEVDGRSSEAVLHEVAKCKNLRMLDLHNSGIKVVSKSIGDLKHLRYLDLSQNLNIKALPNSIGELRNLQTLKLNHCSKLKRLPGAITKLVSLKNLENESCYSLTHIPKGFGQLKILRTLSEFVVSKGGGSVSNLGELEKLNELRGKLKIKNLRCLGGDHAKRAKLSEKQHLVSLVLIWDTDAGVKPDHYENELEDLKPHENLWELSLSAYGGSKFSSWLPCHKKLVKLSLSRCMKCQFLPPLYELVNLEVLVVDELWELKYISEDESAGAIVFQSLKVIQLTNLRELVQWWKPAESNSISAGHVQERNQTSDPFPRLSKLIIEDCPKLISIPLFPSLEDVLVLKNTSWEPFQRTIKATDTTPFVPLSKLRTLCLINMPNGGDPNMFQSLSSLRSLTLDHVQNTKAFLEGLDPKKAPNLQELHIWRCASLKEISWIEKFTKLRILSLKLCPELTIARDEIKLILSIPNAEIEECPQVSHIQRMLEDRLYRNSNSKSAVSSGPKYSNIKLRSKIIYAKSEGREG